jgi:phenylalanyl-tRNA synthetase beta chain
MKISYNWLQQYFDKPLPKPKDLADLINSHVFEVESIENIAGQNGSPVDTVFDIKVMPDRAHHALCHKGVAREVKAITGLEIFGKETAVNMPTSSSVPKVTVGVSDSKLCRRYTARRIENIPITESPAWLREKLEAVGARPINSIVDATNYVMLDVGQPLHAFDADKVKGGIVVRLAKKGEKIELLPERVFVVGENGTEGQWVEKERNLELNETDLIIADDEGPIAIAGVKGGKRAEISPTTKNIILESANFSPVSIRRTATRLGIRNDASKRFENEIIPELAKEAMDQVTALILELSGDKPSQIKVGQITDVFSTPTKPWTVSVSSEFISEKIGEDISDNEVISILDEIGCANGLDGSQISRAKGEFFIVPPLDRLDLKIPEDLVDEVLRVRGYDTLPNVLPPKLSAKTTSDIRDDTTFYWSEKVKNILVDLGYSEVMLYSLVSKGFYEIAYPLASDKSALRESIVPKMKESLAANVLNADLLGLDVVRMFEIGKVFPKEGEKTVLCIGVKNVKKSKKKEPEIIKETLVEIEKALGIKIETGKTGASSADNVIEIDFDAVVKTLAGEFKAAGSTTDLNFQALPRDQKYHPFSPYPFITRDIAVLVPNSVIGDGVWKAIKQGIQEAGAEDLLVCDSLFDVFEKDGKVSYAYRLVFQSYKKTLTDEEVNKIMEKIYDEVKERGWVVR